MVEVPPGLLRTAVGHAAATHTLIPRRARKPGEHASTAARQPSSQHLTTPYRRRVKPDPGWEPGCLDGRLGQAGRLSVTSSPKVEK